MAVSKHCLLVAVHCAPDGAMKDMVELRREGHTYEISRRNLSANNIALVFGVSDNSTLLYVVANS